MAKAPDVLLVVAAVLETSFRAQGSNDRHIG